jgi:hypothetical protein
MCHYGWLVHSNNLQWYENLRGGRPFLHGGRLPWLSYMQIATFGPCIRYRSRFSLEHNKLPTIEQNLPILFCQNE